MRVSRSPELNAFPSTALHLFAPCRTPCNVGAAINRQQPWSLWPLAHAPCVGAAGSAIASVACGVACSIGGCDRLAPCVAITRALPQWAPLQPLDGGCVWPNTLTLWRARLPAGLRAVDSTRYNAPRARARIALPITPLPTAPLERCPITLACRGGLPAVGLAYCACYDANDTTQYCCYRDTVSTSLMCRCDLCGGGPRFIGVCCSDRLMSMSART